MTGRSRIEIDAVRRAGAIWRNVAREYGTIIEEAGVSTASVAARAGITTSTLCRILAGTRDPSLEMAVRISIALDAELSVRVFLERAAAFGIDSRPA